MVNNLPTLKKLICCVNPGLSDVRTMVVDAKLFNKLDLPTFDLPFLLYFCIQKIIIYIYKKNQLIIVYHNVCRGLVYIYIFICCFVYLQKLLPPNYQVGMI